MTPETIYRYTDLEDRTIFEVVRLALDGGGKTFRQRRSDGNGGFVWDLDGVDPVPYRWPWLDLAVDHAETIWVVEGEKDADRLAELGLASTTSAKGAAWAWPGEWAEYFRGAPQVFVLADNDDPGRKAARQRAAVVAAAVPDVRVVELPGLDEKGDVSDWLDGGGSIDELWKLAEASPAFRLSEVESPTPTTGSLELRWVSAAVDDPPEEPAELVKGFLRAGELTAVVAPRAVGKSFLVFNLAAQLAKGDGQFLGALPVVRQGRTLISQGELDEWGSWSRWRMLIGEDAAPEGVAETFERWRLRIISRRSAGRDHERDQNWSEETHDAVLDPRLEATIVANGFDVLVIDPWAVYFAGRENNNDEAEAALDKLRDLAMRTGVALVIVHHISKATEAREPEDLWRGASRLADWASTRVTMLPHYKTEGAWERAGLTRQQARRHLDVHFLRRGTPTEDFSIAWNPRNGWWEKEIHPDKETGGRQFTYNAADVVELCRQMGGDWPSARAATEDMKCSVNTASRALKRAVADGGLETYKSRNGGTGYRLAGSSPQLHLVPDDGDPGPIEPGPDEEELF